MAHSFYYSHRLRNGFEKIQSDRVLYNFHSNVLGRANVMVRVVGREEEEVSDRVERGGSVRP